MLFNKETGKVVGIICPDPLGDQGVVCISFRPNTNGWNTITDDSGWLPGTGKYFNTLWATLLVNCFVVCPD